MSGSAILDLAVGVVFVFLLVSLICTQVGDKVSTWLRWRSKDLESGIRRFIMADDKGLSKTFFDNALIKALVPQDTAITGWLMNSPFKQWVYQDKSRSNLPPKTFVQVLFNVVVPAASGVTTLDELVKAIQGIQNQSLRERLLPRVTKADGTIDNARKNLENWYDLTMEKTTGIYKRNMWGFALLTAALVTLILNVDTFSIATRLWQDSALRSAVAGTAQDFVKNNQDAQALATLQKLDLPIGWVIVSDRRLPVMPADWVKTSPSENLPKAVLFKLAGWLITMLAGAQGAPFWFDLLRKLTTKSV